MTTDTKSVATPVSKWTGVKRTMRNALRWFVAITIVLIGIFIYWKFFYTYSDGYRAGLLQKFSHKGNIVKTYEGEMILSSITSNANVAIASEKFLFSVTDKKLAMQLDTIQGQMVIVHYQQKNGVLFWHGNSEYLVDSVKRK
ncbi:MAG TPA: hypothetical protein VMV56_05750 [Williamwhitmania sp.]|nr:hypothetical protein [Williamwhitmania sp.]